MPILKWNLASVKKEICVDTLLCCPCWTFQVILKCCGEIWQLELKWKIKYRVRVCLNKTSYQVWNSCPRIIMPYSTLNQLKNRVVCFKAMLWWYIPTYLLQYLARTTDQILEVDASSWYDRHVEMWLASCRLSFTLDNSFFNLNVSHNFC